MSHYGRDSRDSYGGRGGRGGGRGEGGRGKGKNMHMGDLDNVKRLISTLDDSVLTVVNPPAHERVRNVSVFQTPPPEDWRWSVRTGMKLDSVIKTNHYLVNTSAIPNVLYHYHVNIAKIGSRYGKTDDDVSKREEKSSTNNNDDSSDDEFKVLDRDVNAKKTRDGKDKFLEDPRINTQIMGSLCRKYKDVWKGIGITYDGRSSLFTSHRLPRVDESESKDENVFLKETFQLPRTDDQVSQVFYYVRLLPPDEIRTPGPPGAIPPNSWHNAHPTTICALDTAILSHARWSQVLDDPKWLVVGNKGFDVKNNDRQKAMGRGYVTIQGYYASFKTCMAGLVLVCDMAVSCFLTGGPILNAMFQAADYKDVREMLADADRRGGIPSQRIYQIEKVLKNAKVKINYNSFSKKISGIGSPANSEESMFECDGERITISQYFEKMAREKPAYARHMNNGKLKFPSLPTIKFGNKKSAMYIPAEFITLIGGQVRKSAMTGDMTRQLILNAAVRPQERMQFINEENNGNAVSVMRSDPTCAAFGVNNVSPEPIKIPGILLPPARLRYRDSVEEPGLSGQWFTKKFVSTPRADRSNDRNEKGYVYGVLIVANDPYHEMPPSNRPIIDQFTSELERESERECAMKLRPGGPPMVCGYHNDEVRSHLEAMYDGGARIVVVILLSDKFYSMIKFHADLIGLPTQCLLWKNVSRVPKGYHSNILLKMNTKMGGTNHTLASRLPNTERQNVNGEVFQDPPASLSWLFDEHCMMVGIDVAHPDSNSDLESTAAVVATMDGRASQYVAHISSQEKKSEIVKTLEVAFQSLLQAFKARNNAYPKHIIVYRDGVSDGQFGLVLSFELSAIKNAISYEGQLDIKVSIIVCQKKHHSRFVYEESPGVYVNPCPGLVLDASCGTNSISSAEYNEFYLNSHVAIQGTAKCAKYTLIYDEIGFKMPELELLTYWTCYLYARCNKSVSHATPIYYAHWAAKRARHLLNAGGSNRDLLDISKIWAQNDRSSSMFFI